MEGSNQNENLILIEDGNETNWNEMKIKKIRGNSRKWKCANKKWQGWKNHGINNFFWVGFTCSKKNL